MLNGKFFTGLPPKMIERRGAAPNRLESHFFWPDDSQVDTAVDTKIKRRNSVQFQANERPQYEKQLSHDQTNVDTKKRFSREFSQSSIQFHDNLNDDRSSRRGAVLRNVVGSKKRDIAEKPTNTKHELPESVVDEAYTTAKKSQAYTSTIQFYDYVNEEEPNKHNRNNLRKPKMDMNNKREMELNTKNSPKLQIKRDVRSLSEEKDTRKINNREVKALGRAKETRKQVNNSYTKREPVRNDPVTEEIYSQERSLLQPRANLSPKRALAKANYEQDIYRAPEVPVYERRPVLAMENNYIHFENPEELVDYRRESVEPAFYANRKLAQGHFDNSDNIQYGRVQPKRILRNNTAPEYEPRDDYQQEHITDRMRTVRIKSPPIKHYYQPQEYYENEPAPYYRSNIAEVVAPTTTRGSSSQRHFVQNDIERVEDDNVNNNNTKNLNNQIHFIKVDTPSTPPAEADTTNALKSQKHLRSSLCFHDGAIVAENDATRSPTSHQSTQRRNVRSSATQRVSVGLPE